MLNSWLLAFLMCTLMSAFVPVGMANQQPSEENTPFQWLPATGETIGMAYPTHRIMPIPLEAADSSLTQIEQEKIQVDAQTTRVIRRAFTQSANGGRRLTETVIEEVRKTPGNRVQATRTISRPDLNGNLNPVQQEIQEVYPAGADTFQISKKLLLPGMNKALVEKEMIQQTERRKADKSVEIDRTRYVQDANGKLNLAERRVSQNSVRDDRVSSEEQVYRYDLNHQLSLAQQIRSAESKDASGQRRWESDSYVPNADGKLQIESRRTIIQNPVKNGRQETSEILEKPSPTAPGEGLKLVRKTVENLRVINPNETERKLQVLEPDLKGGLRILQDWKGADTK